MKVSLVTLAAIGLLKNGDLADAHRGNQIQLRGASNAGNAAAADTDAKSSTSEARSRSRPVDCSTNPRNARGQWEGYCSNDYWGNDNRSRYRSGRSYNYDYGYATPWDKCLSRPGTCPVDKDGKVIDAWVDEDGNFIDVVMEDEKDIDHVIPPPYGEFAGEDEDEDEDASSEDGYYYKKKSADKRQDQRDQRRSDQGRNRSWEEEDRERARKAEQGYNSNRGVPGRGDPDYQDRRYSRSWHDPNSSNGAPGNGARRDCRPYCTEEEERELQKLEKEEAQKKLPKSGEEKKVVAATA